jgi:L-malate glycosyltransferase
VIRHIGLFSRAIPLHGIGGMEQVAWDLATRFSERGIKTTVVTTAVAGYPERFRADGVDVIAIQGAPHNGYSRAYWNGTLQAFDALCRQGLDAVIGVSAGARSIALHRPHRNVPVLMQAHGSSIAEFISKWRKPTLRSILGSVRNLAWIVKDARVFARYDAVVAISEAVRRQIEISSIFASAHAPVNVIPNGIDQSIFAYSDVARSETRRTFGFGEEHRVLVSISRLHRQKGVRELVSAFEIFARADSAARLLIVGDGPDRGALEAMIREKQLTARVTFTGALARHDVARALVAADVFGFLSLRVEGMPLNILEALAAGRPMLLSREVAVSVPEQPGIFTALPGSADESANGLQQAFDYAAKGLRTHLVDEYHLSHCADAYLDLLRYTSVR